jgi:hypothetical protein
MSIKKILCACLASLMLFVFAPPLWADASPTPTAKTIPREKKIGGRLSKAIEKELPRVHDPDKEAKLTMLLSKLTPYLERELDYDVRILELKSPNAFALPGGRIYITTAMLDFLTGKDEMAALFAHELIHADRAHGIVQAARSNRLSLLTIAGIIAAASGVPGAMVLSGAIQTAAINSYSIDLEKEADAKGIDLMRRAGFNPVAMLTMMEKLEFERMKHPQCDPGIFQTHPEVEERIEAARKYLKDNNIEVLRKDVLDKLAVVVSEDSGDLRLAIDSTELMRLANSDENMDFLEKIKEKLDRSIELELSPYEIRVQDFAGERSLIIGGKVILSESQRPRDAPELELLRERLLDAITEAKRSNPLTDYYH